MGAWGEGVFENDDAADFAADITKTTDLSRIRQALDAVLAPEVAPEAELEAPAASEALAAADIVARLRGHFGTTGAYTEKLDQWVRSIKLTPDDTLVSAAQAAVDRVGTPPSELLDLWSEDDPTAWLGILGELKQRLAAPPKTSHG